MLKHSIRDNRELKQSRQSIYDKYHSKSTFLNGMDPFVAFRFNQSLECYLGAYYEESILFAGMALEEHLANIYESRTSKAPSKKFKIKNKVVELEQMDLDKYIIWAKRKGILNDFVKDYKLLDGIGFIRTYYVQSHRVIISKFKKQFPDENFDDILPKDISDPDWFQKIYYLSLGKGADIIHPTNGGLFSHEAPIKILETVFNIIEKTTATNILTVQSRNTSDSTRRPNRF